MFCLSCREDRTYRAKIRRCNLEKDKLDKIHKKESENSALKRQKLRDAGLCYSCGKVSVVGTGRTRCDVCRTKSRIQAKKRREANKKQPYDENSRCYWEYHDLCYFCGSERMDNKKVCSSCYDRLHNTMMEARMKRNNTNHMF